VFRKILIPVGVSFLLGVTCAFAQQAMNTQSAPIPAATRSEMDCSGFIAGTPLSEDLSILDGADNDSEKAASIPSCAERGRGGPVTRSLWGR
jgi:hypothetical protein